MTYKLGVVVIHGIGEQKQDFADGLIEQVSVRLGVLANEVRWMPIWWAPLVENDETELLQRLSAGGHLDWQWLRRFVVHFLADAVAYQRVPGAGGEPGLYVKIHRLITAKLAELREQMLAGTADAREPPLLVVAHSLGGHIMSNYIWDHQHPEGAPAPAPESPFVRAETLAGIVTFGCNIPLFALALPKIQPIGFPAAGLTPQLAAAAQWLNLYDPDDVLGYPLQPLSAGYAKIVRDQVVAVGGLLAGWNPASHNAYWTDNGVTKPIAESIERVLKAIAR